MRDSKELFFASLITHISCTPIRGPKYLKRTIRNKTQTAKIEYSDEKARNDGSIVENIRFENDGTYVIVLTYNCSKFFADQKASWVLHSRRSPDSCHQQGCNNGNRKKYERKKCSSAPEGQCAKKKRHFYPLVDRYVLEEARKFGSDAQIKSKHFLQSPSQCSNDGLKETQKVPERQAPANDRTVICFGITKSRYCGNIGKTTNSVCCSHLIFTYS